MKNPLSFYLSVCAFFGISCLGVYGQTNQPPVVTATGNQIYCPGTPINIVTSFSITDPDPADTTALAVYIQISSGYDSGYDSLTLSTAIAGLTTSWDASAGKLTISGDAGQQVPFATLVQAVQNLVYSSSNPNATGGRTFSISIGEANYLPSTGHYYRFVPSLNITWTAARAAAAADNYYGLQGYLATLTSMDEARLCGEQATGTGWIGGSDEQTEGVWKWMTGPEAGTIFWNGAVNGSTPNFAFWNNNEPNNMNNEDYAHITAPGVGIAGSWNDLDVDGDPSGSYQPKGYIVEFGGMPGDPVLNIAASTTISVNNITSHTDSPAICGSGSVTLQAQSSGGTVYWYTTQNGGSPIATGNSFTTPVLTAPATYYASAYDATCTTATRVAVQANVIQQPVVGVASSTVNVCEGQDITLQASTTAGTVQWFDSPTSTTVVATGNTRTIGAVTMAATFYVGADNNGCISATREAITLQPNALPTVAETNTAIDFCSGDAVLLQAQQADIVSYAWSTGETTPAISVEDGGAYTVTLTNAGGCSVDRTFTVTEKVAPVITDVQVENDKVVVIMQNNDPANYRFALNGGAFQQSNVFYNLPAGVHMVVAQSLNGCGDFVYAFTVNLIPKYFSPNGDNINDVFTIAGLGQLPQATVDIFDRYGKLITRLNYSNTIWDGTLNGYPLPGSDYWYVVRVNNTTPEIRGHFTLLR
nr:T9SS type B sorting domain-containing protein [uncultured Flavobacterium sp.]